MELIEWARKAGVRRLIVNGSYATNKLAPNDVDVIIRPGTAYPRNQHAMFDENSAWPFTQVFVGADDTDLDRWALEDFGTDRMERQKGVVEIIL